MEAPTKALDVLNGALTLFHTSNNRDGIPANDARLQSKVTIRIELNFPNLKGALLQQSLTRKELVLHIMLISSSNFAISRPLNNFQRFYGGNPPSKVMAALTIAMYSFCSAKDLMGLAEGDVRRQSEGGGRAKGRSEFKLMAMTPAKIKQYCNRVCV